MNRNIIILAILAICLTSVFTQRGQRGQEGQRGQGGYEGQGGQGGFEGVGGQGRQGGQGGFEGQGGQGGQGGFEAVGGQSGQGDSQASEDPYSSTSTSSSTTPSTSSSTSTTTPTSTSSSTGTSTSSSSGSSTLSSSSSSFITDCLAYQNAARAAVGETAFTWSTSLASGAQSWANTMANTGNFKHSGTSGVGENIAYGTASYYGLEGLFNMWLDEEQYYIPGCLTPHCTTNSAKEVGHYTQIVWKATTQVGCGVATTGTVAYLCCQYSPQGNIDGESAY